MSFFAELKRRNVFRAASVYAVVAWLLIQIVAAVEEPLGLPEWFDTAVIVLLAIGFPITVVFSWAFEITPEGLKPSAQVDHDQRRAQRTGQKLNIAIIVGLVVAVAFLVVDRYVLGPVADPPVMADRISIAALPFAAETTAAEEDAEFLANGLHDELLTRLAKIRSLRVISRTSVEEYRGAARNVREIGRELGVAHVLEGRVQRAGNMLRVNVQLIDAGTDEHLWAETYDRELTARNIFALQGEMATSIAAALQARLRPQEIAGVNDVPTTSIRAYNFYRSGNDYRNAPISADKFPLALQQYQRAVDEDPEFAIAWAALARAHMDMYWFQIDQTDERRRLSRAAADRAFAIAPDLPEAHLALADYHYHGFRDYRRALEALAMAAPRISETSEFYMMRAAIERRLGDFDAAIADFERASALDPRRSDLLIELATTHALVRNYEQADRYFEHARELAPDRPLLDWADHLYARDGDATELMRIVGDPAASLGPFRPLIGWDVSVFVRDFEAAHRYLDAIAVEGMPGWQSYFSKAVARAETYAFAGEAELAAQHYELGKQQLEAIIPSLSGEPDDGQYYVTYAIALAGLGERAAALAAVDRTFELMPHAVDAIVSLDYELRIALRVLIPLGEHERALELLDELLSSPGSEVAIEGFLPSPALDPIRDDPRFLALVAKHRRAAG